MRPSSTKRRIDKPLIPPTIEPRPMTLEKVSLPMDMFGLKLYGEGDPTGELVLAPLKLAAAIGGLAVRHKWPVVWVTEATLMDMTGLAARTVQAGLKAMADRGWIARAWTFVKGVWTRVLYPRWLLSDYPEAVSSMPADDDRPEPTEAPAEQPTLFFGPESAPECAYQDAHNNGSIVEGTNVTVDADANAAAPGGTEDPEPATIAPPARSMTPVAEAVQILTILPPGASETARALIWELIDQGAADQVPARWSKLELGERRPEAVPSKPRAPMALGTPVAKPVDAESGDVLAAIRALERTTDPDTRESLAQRLAARWADFKGLPFWRAFIRETAEGDLAKRVAFEKYREFDAAPVPGPSKAKMLVKSLWPHRPSRTARK